MTGYSSFSSSEDESSESDESGRRETNGLGWAKREEKDANAVVCCMRGEDGGMTVTRG